MIEKTPCISGGNSDHGQAMVGVLQNARLYDAYQHHGWREDASYTLNTVTDYTALVAHPVYTTSKNSYHTKAEEDVVNTLVATDYKDPPTISEKPYNIVRRLTPMECERLQGYPDGWTDIGTWTDSKGKKHETADSARYKALGNSIALPFWRWMLQRISSLYEETPTLGSLFDGIGGFPLCWESINGKGTAVWASEIEEFPIAVTKLRFPEREHEYLNE